MAEKLISSLIYGEHPIPRPPFWKRHLKKLAATAVILLVVSGAVYKYINYREEARVREFFEDISSGNYDAAYARWDSNGSRYAMGDFLQDWGSEGYYTKGASAVRIMTSHGQGSSVIVQVAIDKFSKPVALRVNKETMKLSFAPNTR
ncbi:MAG TPA: hypothetical protein VFY29_02700 [Terriglobia bacterium]|nr:hypothetical protein [Terriglobia bacterium]